MAEKVFDECKAGMAHVGRDSLDWVPIDPELLKRVYDNLVTGAGAVVAFHTALCGVEMEGDSVGVLLVSDKSGLRAIKGKVVIDCSGDADVAAWAGAEFEQGDETGDLQPATHCFALSNVDMYAYRHKDSIRHGKEDHVMKRISASGKYPAIPDYHACNNIVGPGTVGFNAGHIWGVDNTKPETVSTALMEGRKIAAAFREALAEFFPSAFADSHLVMTGSLLGIRETRRVIGDYVLTVEDFVGLKSFDDEICRNSYYIDVHHKKSEIGSDMEGSYKSIHLKPGESHGLPYRCLTPKGLKNVLVAGRSISTDRAVQGSTRVMPVCLAMGEAAGIAAAHAQEAHGNDVHAVDTNRLRNRLREEGAYLP
jgi:hypothetical protein